MRLNRSGNMDGNLDIREEIVLKRYSPEVIALRDRVVNGNEKLIKAWSEILKIVDKEQCNEEIERWHQASLKLSGFCTQLESLGYRDCLYINETGKKIVKCGFADIGCRVCPSVREYWAEELFALSSPKVGPSDKGKDQMEFLKTLGGEE